MTRISREQMFMDICDVIAKRSTCGRNNVGAIIVDPDGPNIIAMGYNGPAPKTPHCKGANCERTEAGGCLRSVHAETNALERCPPSKTRFMHLYTSFSPCLDCAGHIVESNQITKVYYRTEYRDRIGISYLLQHNIEVYRLTTAGHLIDAATNELIDSSEAKCKL